MNYSQTSLFLLFFALTFYSCGTEPSIKEGFFLHSNGVTIMCPNTQPGEKGVVDGVEYESVDNNLLRSHIERGSDLSKICVSLIETYPSLFDDAGSSMFGQDLGNWDVSNMTTMFSWFRNSAYNQDISYWDVSNVKDMEAMFYGSNFNQPIEDWDVSNVYNMNRMFYDSKFNQPINNWCVEKIVEEPDRFSEGSPLTDQNKPIWGHCPEQ